MTSGADSVVAPGYEAVRDAFEEILSGRDRGAAFAAYVSGREVVYLFGGERAPAVAWDAATLVFHASAAKAFLALCIQILADRGEIDVAAPVAAYWPEFAEAGKDKITVEMILDHTAALPTFERYWEVFTLDNPETYQRAEAVAPRLAASPPLWPPGAVVAYHSETYCFLIGELIRRVAATSVHDFVEREIAAPLGLQDELFAGLPCSEHARLARIIPDAVMDSDELAAALSPATLAGRTLLMGKMRIGDIFRRVFTDPRVLERDLPDAIYATARASARVFGALANGGEADGIRLVSEESVKRHSSRRNSAPCAISGSHFSFALGYMRPTPTLRFGPRDEAFGHPGMGGAVVWADPVDRVGFAFLPNTCERHQRTDHRWQLLADALYRGVAGAANHASERPTLASRRSAT